jgi:ubiquinone/menaquinone biosynthesis C-methylase UbiE
MSTNSPSGSSQIAASSASQGGGRTSDYSRIADRYDATRELPGQILLACYDRLIKAGLFPASGQILDAGCGTGQVSLPLAERGYHIRGIDISNEMVTLAQSKVRLDWRARYTLGDVRDIAEADATFDAVVVSKLLQHVADWTMACNEFIRVARPGSCIVQINETGAFGNSVRRYFRQRADDLGWTRRYVGLDPHSNAELTHFMASRGCQTDRHDMTDLRWDVVITYREALHRIEQRLFAEFWYLPPDLHSSLVADTAAWIASQPLGPDTVEHLKPYLVVDAFRTPAAG